MPDRRHADVLEIFGGEFGQDRPIDLAGAESGFVLFETQIT